MHDDKKIENLVAAGTDIAGAAVGGALGFIAGGPVAAAGAGVVGVGITRVLRDVAGRFLSSREATRVGATAAIALSSIKARLEHGDQPRGDNFFRSEAEKRSSADELFEGTLLAARNTYEEKKAQYLGYLFANVAFDATCVPSEANYHVHVVESLTYTQLVLLQLFSSGDHRQGLRTTTYRTGVPYATISLLHSIRELCDRGLVMMKKPQEANSTIVLGITTICPSDLTLGPEGLRLHALLGLSGMPPQEVEDIAQWLR